MTPPSKVALSSRLNLWKLLKNSGWFLGCIFWRGVFPLDEDFLDRVAIEMYFIGIDGLF